MTEPPPEAGSDDPVPSGDEAGEITMSGADQLAERLRLTPRSSPNPSDFERERFVSLVSYHYGKGTLNAEEFAEMVEKVQQATTLQELYELGANLSWPVPLVDIKPGTRRRRFWR